MKLDKLKKFFRAKRFLALALAAAMTVTSLPQTAYAAEANTPETETAVEVQEEEPEQPVQNAEENGENAPSETESEEAVSSTTQAAETNVEEDVDKGADESEAKETDAQEADNQAEGDGATEIMYTLDASALESDSEVMTAAYDGSVKFGGNTPGYNILSKIVIRKDGQYETNIYYASGFSYKWQKQGADSTSEDTELPVNAGTYQLVITPVEGGTYASAKAITISGFVINKAEVEVDFELAPITPGTAKDKVKDSIEDIAVFANNRRVFTYDPEDENTPLTVTVTVTDPYKTGDNNETSDTVLKKNGDYSAKVTVNFSDKATDEEKGNYNLPQSLTKRITVAELKGTTVSLENVAGAVDAERSDNGATVKVISKTYGEEVSVPAYTPKVKEKEPVIDNDGKEQYNDVTTTDADFSGAWHSAEFRSWTESVAVKNDDGTEKTDENGDVVYEIKTFCSLTAGGELGEGKKPTEAGAYVYRVSYKGDKEQYAGSYADIVVDIAPVEVEVVPQAMEGATFYAGETVESVLSQISWKLNKTIDAENIWGTSYDDVNKTQPYEPVFAVYKVKDNVAESTPMSDTAVLAKAEGVEYQVRFTGKKAVRYQSGYSNPYLDIKNINDETVDSFNSNYKTSTDETKNVLTLTLSAKEVSIDVSPLISDAALAEAGLKKSDVTIDGNTIYTRVYDENRALFENRADYKKALPEDGELTYKWYKWTRSYDLNETYVEVFNGNWNFKSTGNWYSLPINSEDFIFNNNSLKNAGIYKLEITYDDGTAYAQENVYYAIEQQQLRYVPVNTLPTARYGADTQDYITSMTNDPDFSPKLQMRQDNTGDWADTGWIENIDYSIYYDQWNVEAKAPEKEGETPDWEGWRWMYTFTQRTGEEGETVEQNKYRLSKEGNEDIAISSLHGAYNYTFYEYSSKDVETADGEAGKKEVVENNLSVVDITVEKAGEKTLTLKLPEKAIEVEKSYDGTPISVDLSGVKYMDGDKEITPKFIWTWDHAEAEIPSEEAIDGGTYYIYAYYDGDADYAPMEREEVATATIKPIELTVSVKQPLAEEVIAKVVGGNYSDSIYSDYTDNRAAGDMLTVSGYIAEDEAAFTRWIPIESDEDGELKYNYPAWTWIDMDGEDIYYNYNQPQLHVGYGKESSYYGKLKGGETYTLNVDEDYLDEYNMGWPYCYNYTLKAGEPVEITAAYASSTVSLYSGKNTYSSASLTVTDNKTKGDTEQFVHDVTFRESIPYTDALVEENGTTRTVYGNYATVRIRIPAEFEDLDDAEMAAYENALKNAGAITVVKGRNYITATFNLSKDGENGLEPNPVTFSIVWKEGFVEKFTITPTENNLAADLRNAVAPKSVAFNSPKTKMVVGEVQDLDVKITKVQNEDLVYLDYQIVDGEDVLAIGSQGRVTALKEGTATVQVYPVKIVNNSKEQITSVKPAQVKITVSKVAAPKVGTVTPTDESVKVQYPYVSNNGKYYDYGYRREVYVMADNKKTVAEFDAAIAKFEQTGDYKAAGLAAAPVYISNETEKVIADELARGVSTEYAYRGVTGYAKGKNVTLQVSVYGLTPKTPYTVYVRNVSAQRTVLDKDGNKKIAQLSSNGTPKDFKTTLGQVKMLQVKAEGDEKYTVLRMYDADEDESVRGLVRYYEYDLANAAGTQLSVMGAFSAIEAEDTEKAEDFDLSKYYYPLPFTDKTLKTKLLEPKIEYRMYQITQADDGIWEYVTHDYYDENKGSWHEAGEYYWYGNNACRDAAKYTKADKKGALKFAQPEALAVTAYDTVTKTESAPIIVRIKADADSAAGKAITLQVGQKTPIVDLVSYKLGRSAFDSGNPYFAHKATATGNDYLKVDASGNITPVKYEKTAAKQTVTVTGSEGPAVSGASTVTIKDLDPIKNLKFNNLIDNSFMLDFAPSIYAEGYIVDIRNASGKLLQRKYIPQYDEDNPYNDGFIWYYSTKKKAYTLLDGYEDWFRVEGLQAQCKYNVTVTAVYGDAESKAVSKAVTTTKIPAADSGIRADAINDGMGISVFANGELSDSVGFTFVSGNRYTLVADANAGAQYAVTDKLTWSSSDGKVAKISAVGGTYSATLKALKAGTTTIEVKSGILKQTIARWKITIRSVGDAYNNAYFYDENEDLRGEGTRPYEIEAKLVLNIPMAVELAAGESKTYEFVAEEAGNYKVVKSAGMDANVSLDGLTGMSEGDTGYVSVNAYEELASGTITVEKVTGNTIADRTPIQLGENTVSSNGYSVFTAEKEGLYSFSGETGSLSLCNKDGSFISGKSGRTIEYAMKANTTVYVKNGYNTKITVKAISTPSLETGKEYSVEEGYKAYWYTFKAPVKGEYRFTANSNDVSFDVYKDWEAINDNSTLGASCEIEAEKIVYVKVYAYTYADDITFEVIKVEPVVITNDKTVYSGNEGAIKNVTTSYLLTPETDAVYTFTVDQNYYRNSIRIYFDSDEETVLASDSRTVTYPLKEGTTYKIRVQNNSSSDMTLTVGNTEIDALKVDEDAKAFAASGASSNSSYAYLSFTVPESGEGTYKFEVNNASSSYTYVYLMGEPSNNTNGNIGYAYISSSRQSTMEYYLSAGRKVWLQLSNSNNIASSVSVTVKKAGGAVEPLPSEGVVTVSAGQTAWYSYQVNESGRYSITGSDGCYEDMDIQTSSVTERYWKSGSTMYLKKTNSGTVDSTYPITIEKIEPEVWTDISDSKTISGYETKWFAFTAAGEGEIKFVSKSDSGTNKYVIYLYTTKQFEAEKSEDISSVSSVTYPFTEGETVYIKVSSGYGDTTLTAESVEISEISIGENTTEVVDSTVWMKFTAPQTGIYTFEPDDDSVSGYLYLYADKESYVKGSSSQNVSYGNSICYPLIEGTTVYLMRRFTGNETPTEYLLTASMDETAEMQEITLGKETSLSVISGERKWIYFKVADTGQSSYRITGSADSYNYLYCYYASSLNSSNWINNMSSGSLIVGNGYNDYTIVSNYGKNQIMYMYIQPENTGNVKITITEN